MGREVGRMILRCALNDKAGEVAARNPRKQSGFFYKSHRWINHKFDMHTCRSVIKLLNDQVEAKYIVML